MRLKKALDILKEHQFNDHTMMESEAPMKKAHEIHSDHHGNDQK